MHDETSPADGGGRARGRARGVLPLLQAFVWGGAARDVCHGRSWDVDLALARGLGAVAAHVTGRGGGSLPIEDAGRIRGSDLAMRLLARVQDAMTVRVLDEAEVAGIPLVLIKGAATSRRYYPEPHMRAMGDVDVLIPPEARAAFGDRLRRLGFEQRSDDPRAVGPTHSVPFRHREEPVWIDVHTSLHPHHHLLANAAAFSPDAVVRDLVAMPVGPARARAMSHERQLVYTSARWAEALDPARGIFPLLDAALLLRAHRDRLDWDRVAALVSGTWASRALRLMLACLERLMLARVPMAPFARLAARDGRPSPTSTRWLCQMVDAHVIRGRSAGSVGDRHLALVWSALVRPAPLAINLASLPCLIAVDRLRSLSRRCLAATATAPAGARRVHP